MAIVKDYSEGKTQYVTETHEFMRKYDEKAYEMALFFHSLCNALPVEDAFFVLRELVRQRNNGEVDDGVASTIRNFFIMQKLTHADAVSEGKSLMKAYLDELKRRAELEYKRMIEREAREEEQLKLQQIEGREERREVADFINKFLVAPSAKTCTPTETEIKLSEKLVKAFDDGLAIAKIGWFTPRWQFRNEARAREVYAKLMNESPENVSELLKYGRVDYRSRIYRRITGSMEFGI